MSGAERGVWMALALLLSLPLISGCETTSSLVQRAEDWSQIALSKTRSRGEKRNAEASVVAAEPGCANGAATPARIEASEVLPGRVRAGRELNHRLVIATCPLAPEALAGTLKRRFSLQGRTMFEDSEPYALRPGRWTVDVFVGLPAQTKPGAYRLDVRFDRRAGGAPLEAVSEFTVLP
jgi:hypothetical protein